MKTPKLHVPSLLRVGLLILAAMFLAACNTVQGMGKDIKKAGEKIERSAGQP